MRKSDYGWENFVEMLTGGLASFDNPGPLHHPIESFKILRNKGLGIELHSTSHPKAPSRRIDHPPGTIRKSTEFAEISAPGIRARLAGIEPISWNNKYSVADRLSTLNEKSTVQEVLVTAEIDAPAQYVLEWLVNVDKHYTWHDSYESATETSIDEVFLSDRLRIQRKTSHNGKSFSRSCVHLRIGSHDIFFGIADDSNNKQIMPGFILYTGTPDYEIRNKIRTALSFVYGRPLIYIGDSHFDKEWRFLASRSITPYTMDGKLLALHTLPPTPLWREWLNELNQEVFEAAVNAFYNFIDVYDLEHISWLYWHAAAAPVHIGALSFGATFEAIHKAYIGAKPEQFNKTILEPATWRAIRKKLVKVVKDELSGPVGSKNYTLCNIITKRLQHINSLSNADYVESFLAAVNIPLSEKEKIAWRQRNKAAHGGKTDESGFVPMIKEIKMLRLLCNRVLLSMTRCSNQYIDYHSLNFPVKYLHQPIE